MNETFTAGPHHMETASGVYVDLVNPDQADIRLGDIAHHLAQINRYTGAASRPYSVGEHTLLVADRLHRIGCSPTTILRGLHHDDPEAYLGDVGRPLKLRIGTVYTWLEERFEDVIAAALHLPDGDPGWQDDVKAADQWALAAEAWHLMPSRGSGWFVDGLFDPDDPLNPSRVSWLAEPPRVTRNIKELWLNAHRHWSTTL